MAADALDDVTFRHTVFRQQGAHSGHIADVTHLIDPAGAETERGRCQQHIFHCRAGIEKAVAVVAFAGYDEKGGRCEKL